MQIKLHAFARKKQGFQEGSLAGEDNASEPSGSEVRKKRQVFSGSEGILDEEPQRKKKEEEELKQQRKQEFENKSNMFNQLNE